MTTTHGKPVTEPSLYAECVARGIPTDNHYSDLYIPNTDETRALCRHFDATAQGFTSNIDGSLWLDVTFAFSPYWEARTAAR